MNKGRCLSRWLLAGVLSLVVQQVSAQVHSFSSLVVFGDSLADSGNNALLIGADPMQTVSDNSYFASRPFASGRYTNGPVWVENLASRFGLRADPSLLGGSNFAFGGAATGTDGSATPLTGFPFSMKSQLNQYLASLGQPRSGDPAQSLFILSGGAVNVSYAMEAAAMDPLHASSILGAAAQAYAADIGSMVDSMQAAGATHILVLNTANFGLTPRAQSYGPQAAALGSAAALMMNQALTQTLAGENGVQVFDLFGATTAAVMHPQDFGLGDVSHACGAAQYGCDPANSLFYDGQHPSAFGHQMIANMVYAALVPEPSSTAQLALGLGVLLLVGKRRLRRR